MDRRRFLVALPALAAPFTLVRAQTGGTRLPTVGIYLTGPMKTTAKAYLTFFFEGMRDVGRIDGTTVRYEHARYPEYDLELSDGLGQMQAIARELLERRPDVIWLPSSASATAMLSVTDTVPVVGAAVSEVVERGFAISLAKPGKNFTGINTFTWQLGGRRLQLLCEIMPHLRRVGLLMHPSNVREHVEVAKAAEALRVKVIPAAIRKDTPDDHTDVNNAFAQLAAEGAEAVLLAHYPLLQSSRAIILELARKARLPAVGHRTYFAQDGALFAYSTVLEEQMKRSAFMVDKILKGTRAADIPIEQPTTFELVINARTAREYGLTVPRSMLIQANRVIE
jgi:putative tryptophan/tyrosine transport system substrate-binding protein